MRENFDGLAAMVESLGEDPLGGSLYLFRNRRGDRLKLLYWDGDDYPAAPRFCCITSSPRRSILLRTQQLFLHLLCRAI
jgi:hypothetical protein